MDTLQAMRPNMTPQEEFHYFEALYGDNAKLGVDSIEQVDQMFDLINALETKIENLIKSSACDMSEAVIEELEDVLETIVTTRHGIER